MTQGEEGWALLKRDEKRTGSAEIRFYRSLLRISGKREERMKASVKKLAPSKKS